MLIDNPIEIYGRIINNRVVFQPMEGCDGTREGGIDELTERRYLRFAASGAGIIWMEAIAVTPEGRANPRQLYLNENTKASFKNLLNKIRARSIELFGFSPIIIMQMTHSGRFSKPNGMPEPLVAYRNPHWEKGREDQPYKVVSDEYCDELIERYGEGAKLAAEVGFDGIDVKCCHGYLLGEFLSAIERPGRYGGSIENRTRLYLSCIDKVKENMNYDMFVTTRLNACDCFPYPYGYGVNEKDEIDLKETKYILDRLKERGIEMINITLGNPYLIPHFNRPCINSPEPGERGMERIYSVTKELSEYAPDLKIVLSGLSYPSENCVNYADKLLEEGIGALAGFGRMTFAYPEFYVDYLRDGKLDKNKCCIKCSKCTELMRNGSVTGCPIRDTEVYMPLYRKYVLKKEN
jgi:2,4-dienoyl-CoA reductase-like NADH-dependent reductase (Old Yellow Enzyme family)